MFQRQLLSMATALGKHHDLPHHMKHISQRFHPRQVLAQPPARLAATPLNTFQPHRAFTTTMPRRTTQCRGLYQPTTRTSSPTAAFFSRNALTSTPATTTTTTTIHHLPSRHFFFSKPRPVIQGTVTPKMRRTSRILRWSAVLVLFALLTGGGFIYTVAYLTDNIEKLIQFNIKWRGQGDIHYYATEDRVHMKFNPLYTGDKVADVKLLQTKLIHDIYKVYLSLEPLGKNIDTINRVLGDKKVQGLRQMAAEDPELAAEITEDVIMEAQYGVSLSPMILSNLQQQLFQYYFSITQYKPSHSHSPDDLHTNFNTLKLLEEEMSPIVEYTDACLDALVESSVSQNHYKGHDSRTLGLSKPYRKGH